MKSSTKCELCNIEIRGEPCVFASQLIIDGEIHYFCCQQHAQNYKKKRKRAKDKDTSILQEQN